MQEDTEFYRRVSDAVDARLSGKRLAHSHSVSDYAVELARIYGVNQFDAAIAGLLHEAVKFGRANSAQLKPRDFCELRKLTHRTGVRKTGA